MFKYLDPTELLVFTPSEYLVDNAGRELDCLLLRALCDMSGSLPDQFAALVETRPTLAWILSESVLADAVSRGYVTAEQAEKIEAELEALAAPVRVLVQEYPDFSSWSLAVLERYNVPVGEWHHVAALDLPTRNVEGYARAGVPPSEWGVYEKAGITGQFAAILSLVHGSQAPLADLEQMRASLEPFESGYVNMDQALSLAEAGMSLEYIAHHAVYGGSLPPAEQETLRQYASYDPFIVASLTSGPGPRIGQGIEIVNEAGFNLMGFNRAGIHKNGTDRDKYGSDRADFAKNDPGKLPEMPTADLADAAVGGATDPSLLTSRIKNIPADEEASGYLSAEQRKELEALIAAVASVRGSEHAANAGQKPATAAPSRGLRRLMRIDVRRSRLASKGEYDGNAVRFEMRGGSGLLEFLWGDYDRLVLKAGPDADVDEFILEMLAAVKTGRAILTDARTGKDLNIEQVLRGAVLAGAVDDIVQFNKKSRPDRPA